MAKRPSTAVSTRVDGAIETSTVALSEALQQYLAEVGRPGTGAIKSLEDAERLLRQNRDAESASRVMQGWVLASVYAMGEESLRDLSTRVDMSRDSAHQLIRYFTLFQAVPNLESVRTCAHLEFSIAREVAKWPHEQQLAFVSGSRVRGVGLMDASQMTVREFLQAARDPELVKAQRKIEALQADKEGLEADLKDARGSLRHRYEALKMPDFAAHARQESVALAEQMSLAVAAFEDLMLERLGNDKEARQFPEWKDRAAGTGYHALRSVHARTQMLLEKIEETYGTEVTGKIDYEHTLSAGELAIAKDALGVILKRHKAEADNREADRVNAKGGRGRPRGKKRVD